MQRVLGREPLLVEGEGMIRPVGWCTGGGQGYIDQAIAAGVDLYLTGEASEQTFHSARENGVSFIAAGHPRHRALWCAGAGRLPGPAFAIEHLFIDCPNPIEHPHTNCCIRHPSVKMTSVSDAGETSG